MIKVLMCRLSNYFEKWGKGSNKLGAKPILNGIWETTAKFLSRTVITWKKQAEKSEAIESFLVNTNPVYLILTVLDMSIQHVLGEK